MTDALTPRERDVLQLLAQGLTNLEIGRQLHVSERTVRTHLYTIYSKLGVGTRVEATLVAQRSRLVEGFERANSDATQLCEGLA